MDWDNGWVNDIWGHGYTNRNHNNRHNNKQKKVKKRVSTLILYY